MDYILFPSRTFPSRTFPFYTAYQYLTEYSTYQTCKTGSNHTISYYIPDFVTHFYFYFILEFNSKIIKFDIYFISVILYLLLKHAYETKKEMKVKKVMNLDQNHFK